MRHTSKKEEKMQEALQWLGDFFVKHQRMPKVTEDGYYKAAREYFGSADNYRYAALKEKGFTEAEIDAVLSGKLKFQKEKEELFQIALANFKENDCFRGYYSNAWKYFGNQFYLRKAVLEHLNYSLEDMLYTIRENKMKQAQSLEEVLMPLIQWSEQHGYIPNSDEYPMRGNIVKRFGSWTVAIQVMEKLMDPLNDKTVDELYRKHAPRYNPNLDKLKPLEQFIRINKRIPSAREIKSYRGIIQEFLLWDHALDLALDELGYSKEMKIEIFNRKAEM